MGADRDKPLDETTTEEGGPEAQPPRRVSLLVYHRDGTRVVPLERGVPVVVGRGEPSDVVVGDAKLSRQHCRFLWRDDGILVEDLGSKNGTFLNSRRIDEPARLRAGDEVLAGSAAISLHVLSSQDEATHDAEGYDAFSERLRIEITRSSVFGRPVSLVMVRALSVDASARDRHLLPHLKAGLRPVDFAGLYAPGQVLLALPETSVESAVGLARTLVTSAPMGLPPLVMGAAAFPSSAGSAEELVAAAREAARRASSSEPVRRADPVGLESDLPQVVVVSEEMRRLFETVSRVARSAAPVLVLGETGTGKELVARALHDESPRRAGPLRAVNCAAFPAGLIQSALFGHERGAFTGADRQHKGLFEEASGGTVFLDEVGELAPDAQSALLRVLESKQLRRVGAADEIEVDVRIIAATHRDLNEMVEEGAFRKDLLYRLNAIAVEIPPLRERREEIEPLARLFVAEAARASDLGAREIDDACLEYLKAYDWPGNVRELRNVVERAVAVAAGPTITADDLPHRVRGDFDSVRPRDPGLEGMEFKERIRLYEKELIREALRRAGDNQTQAARLLRIPLRTLVHKLKAFGMQKHRDG